MKRLCLKRFWIPGKSNGSAKGDPDSAPNGWSQIERTAGGRLAVLSGAFGWRFRPGSQATAALQRELYRKRNVVERLINRSQMSSADRPRYAKRCQFCRDAKHRLHLKWL